MLNMTPDRERENLPLPAKQPRLAALAYLSLSKYPGNLAHTLFDLLGMGGPSARDPVGRAVLPAYRQSCRYTGRRPAATRYL